MHKKPERQVMDVSRMARGGSAVPRAIAETARLNSSEAVRAARGFEITLAVARY
jgi:hypothetical protein